MLKALRVSFLIPAAAIGAAILPLTGCDKKDGGTTASTASGKSTVGIIDYDRVFTDVGWRGELERSLQATQQEYKVVLESFVRDVDKAVADKKKEIAAKARLNATQAGELERNEKLDQLTQNWSPELKQELSNTLQNRAYYINQANSYAGGLLQRRQAQLIGAYKQALRPIIRRISEQNGLSVVLIPLENVSYFSESADISPKVVDEVQKAPPPHPVPDAQKLELPKVQSITAPPPPTTNPAPAALPTTQPVSPNRGG